MRKSLSLTRREAPRVAPLSMTVKRLPPGPAESAPDCESAYSIATWAGSTPNSSATTCETTVPGLLPQNGQPIVARNPPNASMLSLTLSGVLVSGKGGLSYQNHHSVAL